jgi:hypothetical protein
MTGTFFMPSTFTGTQDVFDVQRAMHLSLTLERRVLPEPGSYFAAMTTFGKIALLIRV